MTFINTSASVSVSTASMINTDLNKHSNTNAMLNQIKSASQFESVIRSTALALLEADVRSILDTLESIVVWTEATEVRVEYTGKVSNPKTKKGMVKRHKTTVLKTGGQVIDTQGTIAQRRAFMASILEEHGVTDIKVANASKKVVNHAAVQAAVAQRKEWNRQIEQHKADKVANAAYLAELSAFEGEIANIEQQLVKLRNATPVRVSKARKPMVAKTTKSKSRPNTHVKVNGKWVAKAAIRNANRMACLTKVRAALTPINQGFACPTPEFGTCLTSIYRTNIVMQQSTNRIVDEQEVLSFFTPEQIDLFTDEELQMIIDDTIVGRDTQCQATLQEAFDAVISEYIDMKEPINQDQGGKVVKHSIQVEDTTIEDTAMISKEDMIAITEMIAETALNRLNTDTRELYLSEKDQARVADFVSKFADKLTAPQYLNIRLEVRAKSGKAIVQSNRRLNEFMANFDLFGYSMDGEVKTPQAGFLKLSETETVEIAPCGKEAAYNVVDAYTFYGRFMNHVTANLTAPEKADFVKSLTRDAKNNYAECENPNAVAFKPSGGSGSIVTVDFNAGTVTLAGRDLEVNPTVDLGFGEVAGVQGLFLFALTLINKSLPAVNTLINNCPSLFKNEENYGASYAETDLAHKVVNNFNLPVKLAKAGRNPEKFPFFGMSKASWNLGKIAECIGRGELMLVDKYNMKWGATGTAAESVLLGCARDEQNRIVEIYNLNDANKEAKVYNRPAANKYLFAQLEDRVNSNFAVALSDGTVSYSAGKMARTVFSTQRFANGSGVAMINKEFGFDYTVAKTVKETFNVLTLPAHLRKGDTDAKGWKRFDRVADEYVTKFNTMINEARGKVFGPGKTILGLEDIATGTKSNAVVRNSSKALDLRVTGGHAVRTSETEVLVRVDVEIVGTFDQYVKLRGIGKKCTTLPYEVLGLGNEWDILLNIEAVKGWPALIEMFCNAQPGTCHYLPNNGELILDNGVVVDLKAPSNMFTRWCEENTEERIISFKMNRASYNDHLPVILPHLAESLEELKAQCGPGPDCFVEDNNEADWVIMHERVQMIKGDMVFDVEVSVPKESVSWTQLTLEAANGISIQDRELGNDMLDQLKKPMANAQALLNSLKHSDELPTFNVSTIEGRQALAAAIGGAPSKNPGFTNHKQLFIKMLQTVAGGFRIKSNSINPVTVHPLAFNAFGGFTSGSATREVAEILDFLYFVTDDSFNAYVGIEGIINAKLTRISRVLKNWATNLVQSAKCMKKITRCGNLLGGKVRTSYDPRLNDVIIDGVTLPVVMMNPAMAQRFVNKASGTVALKDGDIIGITRTPMPFMTACVLRVESDLPDAHVFVRPKVWHAANEGDSDGDGIAFMNLTQFGFDVARAARMNESLMGPAGYEYVYGANLPVFGFCEYDDKWGKKSLNLWGDAFLVKNLDGEMVAKSPITVIKPGAYGMNAAKVAEHYLYNVGASYGVCSALAFQAANAMQVDAKTDADRKIQESLVGACVIAWRLVYEGCGLSGYSKKNKAFFELLNIAKMDPLNTKPVVAVLPKGSDATYMSVYKAKKAGILDQCVVESTTKHLNKTLSAAVGCGELSHDALIRLIFGTSAYTAYRSMEKKGIEGNNLFRVPGYKDAKVIKSATLFGCLRRLGQGNDPVDVAEGESYIAEGMPMSLIEETRRTGARGLYNSRMVDLVNLGTELFHQVSTQLAIIEEESNR